MTYVRMLMLSGLGLPFLLINDGGSVAWLGVLLLAAEAVLSIALGRRVVRASRGRTVRKILPMALFLGIYFFGNVLATLAIMVVRGG